MTTMDPTNPRRPIDWIIGITPYEDLPTELLRKLAPDDKHAAEELERRQIERALGPEALEPGPVEEISDYALAARMISMGDEAAREEWFRRHPAD